eukprot:Gregarina_sp_Poly_1__10521@NODE_774_length_6341_cov_258_715014_g569_i0_p2_GENE_NODE_774_length_6341_cov_258_715014_g569_i0NODE_774_length_6341_cov_258_715014_g569_i0_p2_ORF_typecomplete_len359_score48_43PfkB/PF00294_24/7_8e47_NODE_774_length_6341_cov_258_715014_g569_i031114187
MSVLVAGNPILDLLAVLDVTWLKKFNVTDGGYTEYSPELHGNIYLELRGLSETTAVPGGAGQNTARVCQALIPDKQAVIYLGAVGNDAYAKLMEEGARAAGLQVYYELHPDADTGTCGVIVNSETRDRSMCTNIGAANKFSMAFLKTHWPQVEAAKCLFTAGFFVTACPEGMLMMARHAASRPDCFWGVNLCAPFIVKCYTAQVKEWFKYANFVVGNELEWAAIREVFEEEKFSAETSLLDVAAHLCSNYPMEGVSKKTRAFIITQGAEPTLVAWKRSRDGTLYRDIFPVTPVPKELRRDATGCGDAFIGGVLAGLYHGLPIEKCVELGNICGREVLQHEGVIFDLAEYSQLLCKQAN